MKKKFISVLCLVAATLITCTVFFAGCIDGNSSKGKAPKEYTVQYTDDIGTHQFTVTEGMP